MTIAAERGFHTQTPSPEPSTARGLSFAETTTRRRNSLADPLPRISSIAGTTKHSTIRADGRTTSTSRRTTRVVETAVERKRIERRQTYAARHCGWEVDCPKRSSDSANGVRLERYAQPRQKRRRLKSPDQSPHRKTPDVSQQLHYNTIEGKPMPTVLRIGQQRG